MEYEQTAVNPLLQIDAYGAHITDNLFAGFLKSEIKAAFATSTSGIDKVCGQARFTCSGVAGDENVSIGFEI